MHYYWAVYTFDPCHTTFKINVVKQFMSIGR